MFFSFKIKFLISKKKRKEKKFDFKKIASETSTLLPIAICNIIIYGFPTFSFWAPSVSVAVPDPVIDYNKIECNRERYYEYDYEFSIIKKMLLKCLVFS